MSVKGAPWKSLKCESTVAMETWIVAYEETTSLYAVNSLAPVGMLWHQWTAVQVMARQMQSISFLIVDLYSAASYGIHVKAITQKILKISDVKYVWILISNFYNLSHISQGPVSWIIPFTNHHLSDLHVMNCLYVWSSYSSLTFQAILVPLLCFLVHV